MNSKTKLVCLLGKPVEHSLSPAMQNAGFTEKKINYVYLAFETDDLGKAILGLRELGVVGFNITMPYKTEAIKHLDKIGFAAKKIGAVNTVVNKNGELIGHNTDGLGAVNALKKKTGLKGKRILLLGAGGAAKAIAFALKNEGARITIAGRKKSKSKKAQKLAKSINGKNICIEEIVSLEGFDILINATPVGMKPNQKKSPVPAKLLHKKLVVFDIVYSPLKTELLKEAKKKKCKTIGGIEMLLEQGYLGFELFTGKKAPKEKMRKAIIKELN